ncbi:MAG: hypothetical protein C4523_13645 [Myxococcales bacterium]|nr:MAG: hypothetical protein C4523_13645 [Myxococcales bacterium]
MTHKWLPIALLFAIAMLTACGGGDTNTDGDMDGEEGPSLDGEIDFGEQGTDLSSVSGSWQINDSNLKSAAWYNRQALTGYFLIVKNDLITHWMPYDGGVDCLIQQVVRESEKRFVPKEDPENCWFELELNDDGELLMNARHNADTEPTPWFFKFQRIESVPEYSQSECNLLRECLNYNPPPAE